MSSTEEANPAAPEAPATEVQAPAQKVKEPEQTAMDTSPAQTESVSASTKESQQTETSQTQPPKETDKIAKPAQPFIKPPVPKTIQTDRPTKQSIEQMEEAKLKAKFGGLQKPGGSQFLQARLNKGLKYFDSGDYNVAKQTGKLKMRPPSGKPGLPPGPNPTGQAIPTPDSIHHRKPSSEISKLAV